MTAHSTDLPGVTDFIKMAISIPYNQIQNQIQRNFKIRFAFKKCFYLSITSSGFVFIFLSIIYFKF